MKKSLYMSALLALTTAMPVVAQDDNDYTDSIARQVNVAFGTADADDLLGGISSINMVELTHKNYSTYSLDNLEAYVGSLNWNQGDYLVLVDGVPRNADNVLPTEIEQITFMRSAQAVVLYGSRAAKGAVLITTKRGRNDGLKANVRGNFTVFVPKSYPKYLGSAMYASLYNEALANDGKPAVFSEEDIYHYSIGDNPYRYPELNFFSDDYLDKTYQRYDGTVEISGGGEMAHFYTNIGLSNVNDLIGFGEGKDNHTTRLNVRGNIDLKLSDWLSAWVNGNATFYDQRNDNANYWAQSATLRPTSQYPLTPFVPISMIDVNNATAQSYINNSNYIIDGQYLLGGTQNLQTNPFAAMYAAGHNTWTSRQLQFDLGARADLGSILEGLSFTARFAVDYNTSYTTGIYNDYATYEPVWTNYNGADMIATLNKYGTDKRTGIQNVSGSTYHQTMLFNAQFDYKRTFADVHNVSATLLANGWQQSTSGEYHRTSNANLGLQLNYNYDRRYYADFSAAVVHSSKLAEGHREAFSPVFTLGWRISKENFMKDVKWLNNLMLTVSYGVINQDIDLEKYFMYEEQFTAAGAYWGWNDSNGSLRATGSLRGGNEELTFIKRKEFRLGLNATMFDGLLNVEANYFNINNNGFVTTPTTIMPLYFKTYYPDATFMSYMNYNDQRQSGITMAVNVHKKFGEVDFQAGVNAMYYTSKNTKVNESVEYEWQKAEGQSVEAIRGYECLGFFQDAADVANSAKVNANTKPGDLKYKDQNDDGIIDEKDKVVLGKWRAPWTMGLNLTAKYKNFTLFVNATGNFGGKNFKNDKATWVYGDGKYSEIVLGRWTPETANTATYPRLTSENSAALNFVESDFWLYSTSAFYLNKVQVTYDFPKTIFNDGFVKGLQVYVSGADLLTIAGERKYLETNVGSAPKTRSYNLGVKVNF